jgi:hypothetical protein
MAVRAKVQKDYFLTEVSIDLPSDPAEIDSVVRAIKTTGKMVTVYYDGHIQGINVEQKTKLTEHQSAEIRRILGLSSIKV